MPSGLSTSPCRSRWIVVDAMEQVSQTRRRGSSSAGLALAERFADLVHQLAEGPELLAVQPVHQVLSDRRDVPRCRLLEAGEALGREDAVHATTVIDAGLPLDEAALLHPCLLYTSDAADE